MRRYCRSTAAHNVLQIDDADQCDLWSRFRMGYRGWPSTLETGNTDGFSWARATHNAYRRLGVPRVGRWLACRPGGPWFCVDWAEGRGRHHLTSRLHLHPQTVVLSIRDGEVQLGFHGSTIQLSYLTPGKVDVVSGWYCPEFGRGLASPVIEWSAEAGLPAFSGWCLALENTGGIPRLDCDERGSLWIRWTDRQGHAELHPLAEASIAAGSTPY